MRSIGERKAFDDDRRKNAIARMCARSVPYVHIIPETTMAHVLDPKRIDNESKYNAALGELDALMAGEPDACAERRIDELFGLIEDYQLRKLVRAPKRADVM